MDADKKILRARLVLTGDGNAIDDAGVEIAGNRIVDVGPMRELRQRSAGPVTDLGEVLLMPGLINAHCHLDFTCMRGAILSGTSFSAWVRRINDLKRTLTDSEYLQSIADGFAELQRHGTTTVFNIESFPELMMRLPPPPIRTWWFYELMDIRNRLHTEEVVAGALTFFEERPGWTGGFGLAPHAPFTTSPDLYRAARDCSLKYGMPMTTHLAESDEEFEMFANGSGRMFDFLAGLGRDMSDAGRGSPVAHLLRRNLLARGSILAHMNQLAPTDDELLAAHAGEFSIVHCPNCHAYFDRPDFPYERLRRLGFEISLGTDSLASNRELNLFSEMRTFARNFPGVSPGEILRMVTANPAAAIGLPAQLGKLSPGAFADLIAIPFNGSPDNAAAHVVDFRDEVNWMRIDGKEPSALVPRFGSEKRGHHHRH